MAKRTAASREGKSGNVKAYERDLAYIHDAGFRGFAESAAPFLISHLRGQNRLGGLIVELGCGSGIQAAAMTSGGYDVLGFDISPAMIELAKQQAPKGEFRVASFLDVEIPRCLVVTAVGEIFNYLFDERNSPAQLENVFRRVLAALEPGGWFLFDVALVGRIPEGLRRTYAEGADWACLYEGCEDASKKSLTRQITTFRRAGEHYQRHSEMHRLRLYEREPLCESLRKIGFRVRTLKSYGEFAFPPGYAGFLCRRPTAERSR
jgi:SAM-dependent methyltransferase